MHDPTEHKLAYRARDPELIAGDHLLDESQSQAFTHLSQLPCGADVKVPVWYNKSSCQPSFQRALCHDSRLALTARSPSALVPRFAMNLYRPSVITMSTVPKLIDTTCYQISLNCVCTKACATPKQDLTPVCCTIIVLHTYHH